MSNALDSLLSRGSPTNAGDDIDDINDTQYRAFKIGVRTTECELRTVHPVQYGVPFSYTYTTIAYSGDYSRFWTVTSFFLLKVRGRNLREVVRAMRSRSVAWLQEFDERKHGIPEDPDAPVITQMDVLIQPAPLSYEQVKGEFESSGT